MRRKGERKLERQWAPWGPSHPVARNISEGTGWFHAWLSQACTPLPVIVRKAGIPKERTHQLLRDAWPTAAEIEALAVLWNCPAEDIVASLQLPY